MRTASRHDGFSIVELLVVISILALLVAMLLPAMSKAREVGRTAVCASGQRQLQTAVHNYFTDNSDWLPASRNGPYYWAASPWTSRNSILNGVIYPYVAENEDIYKCPTFLGFYKSIPGLQSVEAAFTYSMSEYVGNSWQGQVGIMKFDEIRNPSTFLTFTDENPFTVPTWSNYTINNGALGVGAYNNPGSIVDCVGTFHLTKGDLTTGLSNVVFWDGHADLHDKSESKDLATPVQYR